MSCAWRATPTRSGSSRCTRARASNTPSYSAPLPGPPPCWRKPYTYHDGGRRQVSLVADERSPEKAGPIRNGWRGHAPSLRGPDPQPRALLRGVGQIDRAERSALNHLLHAGGVEGQNPGRSERRDPHAYPG